MATRRAFACIIRPLLVAHAWSFHVPVIEADGLVTGILNRALPAKLPCRSGFESSVLGKASLSQNQLASPGISASPQRLRHWSAMPERPLSSNGRIHGAAYSIFQSAGSTAKRSDRTFVFTAARPKPDTNFFSQFFKPQRSPADLYDPSSLVKPPGLPTTYANLYKTAAVGIKAAIADGIPAVEVDFPPIDGVLARGEYPEANAAAAAALKRALGRRVVVIGCNRGVLLALRAVCGEALDLSDGADAVAASPDVTAIVVQPAGEEQWKAAEKLNCRCVVVLNGLMREGTFPQAYYFKPMTAFSRITGGVVRLYPGPYTAYGVNGRRADLRIGMKTMGRRALPDTAVAQKELETMYALQSR